MREDTQLSLKFKMISGKKVTADFTSGDVSSDGGVLALREITDSIGIIDQLVRIPYIRVMCFMIIQRSLNSVYCR